MEKDVTRLSLVLAALLAGVYAMPVFAQAPKTTPAQTDRSVLPLPTPPFAGVIGKTYKESKEAWPPVPTPPSGAPNMVVILLDDVGFGQRPRIGFVLEWTIAVELELGEDVVGRRCVRG